MKNTFKNLKELIEQFKDEKVCREFLEQQRWNGKPICPHCKYTEKIYKLGDGKTYKCGNKECYKKFTVTVGTIFENSNIKLPIWFAAMYIITAHKKGISSIQLSRDLSVTQKTAWFINHRIREMLKESAPAKLKVHVQADETYVGGKNKNRHKKKRILNSQGRSTKDKTPVVGLLEKDGKVLCFVVDNTEAGTIQPLMHNNVEQGATLVTDSYRSYIGLADSFKHVVVKHTDGEYVVDNQFHTNNIENFWSLFKRGIIGIYHFTSKKHLQRYCDEFGYRYNSRKELDKDRFVETLKNIGNARIRYSELIGKVPIVDKSTGEVMQ